MMGIYTILEVSPDADEDAIIKSYHRLALLHQPDKAGPESTVKFQEIHDAYQSLMKMAKSARRSRSSTSESPHNLQDLLQELAAMMARLTKLSDKVDAFTNSMRDMADSMIEQSQQPDRLSESLSFDASSSAYENPLPRSYTRHCSHQRTASPAKTSSSLPASRSRPLAEADQDASSATLAGMKRRQGSGIRRRQWVR